MAGYTIKQFREQFPNEDACLEHVFQLQHGNMESCSKCGCVKPYKRVKDRRCYQCPKCYNQVYPTVGTIFEKSTTPLMHWFYAMFLFTASKNGLSAMELMRQIGCSYKTAWRMLKQIRILIKTDDDKLEGVVEADETFVGGKNINRHHDKKVKNAQGRSFKDKTPVLGLLSNGKVRAFVVKDTKAKNIQPYIKKHVKADSYLVTDEWSAYNGLEKAYNRNVVDHGKGQYVNDAGFTTNRIENFWSHLKRTLKGSYIQVSKKYLQLYVNECMFRFNNKGNKGIFHTLLNSAFS